MNGITILSEYTYNKIPLSQLIKDGFFIIVLFVILLIGMINTYREKSPSFIAIAMGTIILVTAGCLIIHEDINDYRTIYTDYKITIDDTVGFNEFYENYDIVSKKGDVYTVRKINNE